MPNLDIGYATASNMTSDAGVTVDTKQTEGASGNKESTWTDSRWTQKWGYFTSIPEWASAVKMKAIWTIGKGFDCSPETKVILENIQGFGKQTFDDILFSMVVVMRAGGNAYAEIIRDDEGNIINLKLLDPQTMRHVVDEKGRLLRFEQTSKVPGRKDIIKFDPKEIFYLGNNIFADQFFGMADVDVVETTILAEFESFDDCKKIFHRQAKPMIMFKLGTQDQTKINAFISKMDAATRLGENIYIPDDENSVSYEVVQVNVSQMLLEWRNNITNKFYRAVGLPLVLFGQAGSTESGGKMEYLAHEQVFAWDQRFLERQIEEQLGLKIKLNPPTSLLNDLQTDERKDANQGLEIQPQDATAGAGQ